MLAAAGDKEKWLEELARNPNAPSDYGDKYNMARRYMLHAPVLEKDKSTGKVVAVPLNPLPHGVTDWADYLGFDWKANALVGEEDYHKIYNVDLVPLTGKSMSEHLGPRYSAEENPTVPTTAALATVC